MNVYQASDGQWIVYNEGIKTFFATEAEAIAMSEKIIFAENAQAISQALALLIEKLPSVDGVWAIQEYGVSEADEMIDEDVVSTGNTAAEIAAFVTFSDNFQKFLGGLAIAPAVYRDTLNKLRKDM